MNTSYKNDLNESQLKAVTSSEGPVLVLAGAGTGKTRVITYRIAYLINELNIAPDNILALTFTNKAADEMKSRIRTLVEDKASGLWMGTFHSICLAILRRDGYRLNLPALFGIADQEDRLAIVKNAMKTCGLDVKKQSPKQYLQSISTFKNTEDYVYAAPPKEFKTKFASVYKEYQDSLYEQKLIDFDDMLALTVRLFINDKEVLNEYREIFKYILVDEYQDTNSIQFKFLYLLAGSEGNICVVGDDDQSIYGWRGAEVRNILEFDRIFSNVREIKLTDNYRSGGDILEKANNLISKNRYRRGKSLYPAKEISSKVQILRFYNEEDEASSTAECISAAESEGRDLSQVAILYRTNSQSRNFEKALNEKRIAYKIIGSTGFYQRREIKDILSYLRFYANGQDGVSFRRSIKTPGRGIGDATIDKILNYSAENSLDILSSALAIGFSGKIKEAVRSYAEIMSEINKAESIKDKIDVVVSKTDYINYIRQFEESSEAERREENIQELYNAAALFEETYPGRSLSDFLDSSSLITSGDEDSKGAVRLMTIHSAKGLEFETVFLTGLEEGLFPLSTAVEENNLEEERRLCYVGITRAKNELYITRAANRYQHGFRQTSAPSRFLKEMEGAAAYEGNAGSDYKKTENFSYRKNPASSYANNSGLSSSARFPVSSKVVHNVFGEGVVVASEGSGATEKSTVQFKHSGLKKVLAAFLKEK